MCLCTLLLLEGLLLAFAAQWPRAPAGSPVDICSLPPETGPCLGLFHRWYYSPHTRRCQLFDYGGCKGNANNFKTLAECRHKCARKAKDGECPAPFQDSDVMCGQFCSIDASCPGSERCCKTVCGQRCQLPSEAIHGHCPKVTTKPSSATFCLSGCTADLDCGRNVSLARKKRCSFGCHRMCLAAEDEHPGVCPLRRVVQTFVPCNDTCDDDRDCPLTQKCCFTGCRRGCLDPVRSDRCQLPPETGPCRGHIRRYFYSPSQKKCLQFVYGGCQGNSNNFETKEACEEACGKISPEVCKLPKDSGPCLGYSEMYYFNSATKTCEIFVYGLCGGNGNRFPSKSECLMVCGNLAKSPAQ